MSGLHFRSLLENDVFVDVFGHPQRTHILKSFLNAVFAAGGFPLVTTLTLLPRENSRSEPGAKLTIVDVKAETETGETIQVEVQFQLHAGLSERMVYTWTQTYGRAIVAGKSYAEALPVRSVWILGENLFTDDGQKLHSFRLHDDVSGRLLNSHCHILTLELKKWADFATFESDLDSWAFLLRNAEYIDPEFPPPMLKKSGLEDAMAVMRSWTKEEIDGFAEDRRKQEEILWVTLVKEWEAKKRAEAIAEGIEKGRTEGKAEGIAQGEKLATIGLGRKLRARGMGIEEICDLTGLSAGDLD